MREHYEQVLRDAEIQAKQTLANQCNNKDDAGYGGIIVQPYGFIDPCHSIGGLMSFIPLYLNKDSEDYKSSDLYEAVLKLLDYIERVQRPDGTFDSLITNFYSAPDTAFAMQNLAYAYKLTANYGDGREKDVLQKRLFMLIKTAGYGIMNGGFHTPNHRWVVAAALALAYNIVGIEDFKLMALRYLAEGIDCDENGEYTERSVGVYNAIVDNALIIIAEELGRDDLLEHVKRNLDLMFYYIEPDGSLFTMNSIRQDKGQKYYPNNYYPLYLYMAYRFKDKRYEAMTMKLKPNGLYWFMNHPELIDFIPEQGLLPVEYEKFYENSGAVRMCKGDRSVTLLKDSSSFLFFQAGSITCYMKICASFFAVAQFRAQTIEKGEQGYRLSFTTSGSYKMPFEQPPETSDWSKMDHSKRQRVKVLNLNITVSVREIEGGIEIEIETDGCDRVPIKIECCVSPDVSIKGEGFMCIGQNDRGMTVSSGYIYIINGIDSVRIGPAFAKHNYTNDMRGSEPPDAGGFTIYFTDYTNIDKKISIIANAVL